MITTLTRPTTSITQETFLSVLNQRRAVKELEDWLSQEKARLLALEDQIVAGLEAGLPVEAGERTAQVKTLSRRVVAWKDAFVKYLGVTLAEKVSQETVPQIYKRLEIA